MFKKLRDWELRSEGYREGFAIGYREGLLEILNPIVEYLKSEGMSGEQINRLRNTVLAAMEEIKP